MVLSAEFLLPGITKPSQQHDPRLNNSHRLDAGGDSWLLSKRNDLEAVVERHPIDALPRLAAAGVAVAVLKFWGRGEQAYRFSRSDSRSESSGGSGGGDRNRVSGEALPSTLVVPPP